MRTYSLTLAGIPLALFMAGPCAAQDSDNTYDGPYIAVTGGYDIQSNDLGSQLKFDRNGDGNFNEPVVTSGGANAFSPGFCNGRAVATANVACENDRDGASYSVRAGYDRQLGPIVVGLVGEFGTTKIRDYVSGFSTTPAAYTLERGVDWEASGRARVGYAPGNNGLFYLTGGVGYARFNHRFATTNTANSFSTLLDDRDRFGFVVGGGVEAHVTKRLTFGLEYTYHDYKDGQYLVRATQGTAPATNPFVLAPYPAGTTITRTDDNFRWMGVKAVLGFHF